MTRLSLFDSPLLLGFDDIERTLERIAKSASSGGYPPYNIEQIGETRLRITLAVAGFSEDDLSVNVEDHQLVIRGKQSEAEEKERVFLHRGIAARQFQRTFVLSDDIEITGATMDNGLLHIDMVRILPEKDIRKIKIQSGKGKKKNPALEIDNHSHHTSTEE